MSKFFDIMPPQSRRITPPSDQPIIGLKLYSLIVLIMMTAFFLAKYLPTSPVQNTMLESDSSLDTSNQNIALNTEKTFSIRIINASDKIENTDKIKELTQSQNYTIEQTNSVENRYDQTIIYYKPGQIEEAQKLELIIKSMLDPKLEESQTLASTFDFLIIIGQK